MALWLPLGAGRNREIGLTATRETLLYGTEDLTETADVTTDSVRDVELNAPGTLGQPHPDPDMAARGSILVRKYLVLGPASGRAVVALEYGPPTPFGPGSSPRSSVELTSGSYTAQWPKAKRFPIIGPPAPNRPELHWIEWVTGPRRSTLRRVVRKAFSVPPFSTFDQTLTAIANNLGKKYDFGIPFVFDDFSINQTQGTLATLQYIFRTTAPVRGHYGATPTTPAGNGFDLPIPDLSWLEEWYVNDLDPAATVAATQILVHRGDELYEDGGPLP